jgi:hypothetical protein
LGKLWPTYLFNTTLSEWIEETMKMIERERRGGERVGEVRLIPLGKINLCWHATCDESRMSICDSADEQRGVGIDDYLIRFNRSV